jgi:hypothetical protein
MSKREYVKKSYSISLKNNFNSIDGLHIEKNRDRAESEHELQQISPKFITADISFVSIKKSPKR